jgi:hypothetical protein
MKQEVTTFIAWLVAIYIVICVAAYFGNAVMSFPDPTRSEPMEVGLNDVNEIEMAVPDGIALEPDQLRVGERAKQEAVAP